jgi:hypothetical protein
MTLTWVLSSCITCLSLLRGTTFNYLQIDKGITLEDAPKLTKQLWRFLLKTSNVKRNGGTKGFPFLSSEKVFSIGLFTTSVEVRFLPRLVLVVGFSTDFKSCDRKSFLLRDPTNVHNQYIILQTSSNIQLRCNQVWVILRYGCL